MKRKPKLSVSERIKIQILLERNLSFSEIDFNDPEENYRHKGVSEEHRLDSIVGLRLFIDIDELPLKFNIFNGNTAESLTLIPALIKVKQVFNVKWTIVVLDKGINTSQNITKIVENGDGFFVFTSP